MAKKTATGVDFFASLKARAGDIQKLAESPVEEESERLQMLPLEVVLPNPDQPRHAPSPAEDEEFLADVKERGILQPVIVRPSQEEPGKYLLVAGNRRTIAARQAGLAQIPAIVRHYSEKEARTVAAIENLQRKDLDPSDEARYFKFLGEEYNLSNRDIAKLINKSPSYVDQRMRILEKRVKNTQLLSDSQSPNPWKYKPKEWQKIKQAVVAAREGYKSSSQKDREILKGEIQDLKHQLTILEKELGEYSS